MFVSTKNFQTGLSDGRRDAKASWTEDGGYWMWLWMTDEQYQTGYEQGWKQGRQELNYERQQNKSERIDQERESSEEAPPIGE